MVQGKRSNKANSNSRKMSRKQVRVGNLSSANASFAAKLGAFICENQNLRDVVGDVNGFEQRHNGRAVNQRVFGVLPFLHLNITRKQFLGILNSPKVNGSIVSAVETICNAQNLNSLLESVNFNCNAQSKVGVREGLTAAIMESIENRWGLRKNGRRVLNKIQAVQEKQYNKGKGVLKINSTKWYQKC